MRSTFTYSMIDVDQGAQAASASEGAWSASANLFFAPTEGLLLGAEYRHAERELFSGADGSLDRLHFAVKQSF